MYSMEEQKPKTLMPVYRFTWTNGRVRTTEDMLLAGAHGVEVLADLGRTDPDCTVDLIGYMG